MKDMIHSLKSTVRMKAVQASHGRATGKKVFSAHPKHPRVQPQELYSKQPNPASQNTPL